jgi:hypothetical protein
VSADAGKRRATAAQIHATITGGRATAAKFGRTKFRRVFPFNASWNAKRYAHQQIEAFAVTIPGGWLVITVIVKYF